MQCTHLNHMRLFLFIHLHDCEINLVRISGTALVILRNYPTDPLGPVSSVGIATDYGLHGPGIESRWGEIFPPVQTGPGAHPASSTMGTGSFLGGKEGPGRDAGPSYPSSAVVMEE